VKSERELSQLRRDLRASTIDGAAFSATVGVGETYLPAFLLAVGSAEVVSGLIATVPVLAGAVLQLVSPVGVRWLRSAKRWVVACAATQTLSLIPLIVVASIGRAPVWPIFVIAAVYWGAGMGTGPAWNTWIGTIVPPELRAKFFARRTRICQVTILAGLLLGGALLQLGKGYGQPVAIFAAAFAIAAVARLVSVTFLSLQSEPRPMPTEPRRVSPVELVRRLRGGPDARLLLYLLAITVTAQIAGPFFTPYMLGEVRFSYVEYMILMGTSYAAKIVVMPALGRLAHRYGAQRLLWIGGIGLVPLSAFWLVSDSFTYLFGIQVIAGCAWGAYELATFLLIFETIHEEERTSVLTLFNLANAVLTVGGSLLGGALLKALGQDHDAYATVFAASAAARALTLLLLFRVAPVPFEVLPMMIRTLALRPSAGSLDAPIVASIPASPSEGNNPGGATERNDAAASRDSFGGDQPKGRTYA
jgi:MFS family permease